MRNEARTRISGKARDKRPCAPSGRRARTRPALEWLERRIALSVGGGWISNTQSGQSGDGLLGQYYSNSTLAGSASFNRWDDRIDLSSPGSNSGPGGSPDPAFGSVGPDNWSAQWTGTLTANFSEAYNFLINSAGNGVRLWVTPVGQPQGNPLINDWTSHSQQTDTGTMTLQAGQDYNVELEYSQTSGSGQHVQLQWSSPSTPLEDIEPVTHVGLNVEGGDALFANMVNGGTQDYWWVVGNFNVTIPTDSNFWPETDGEVFLGEGDGTTEVGGAYLVQFTGMATVTDSGQNVDWWVNGTDLQSGTLQAGRGYNPVTNTTTATMFVYPSTNAGFLISFTNTSRTLNASMNVTAISEANGTVTVSVPSVSGIAQNQEVTIAGYGGSAAQYNGTFVITGVNTSNNTFTYTDSTGNVPNSPSGGTALVNPQNGITNLYVMQPTTLGGNTPSPAGTLFNPAALTLASQYTVLRFMDLNDTNGNLTSNWSDRTLVSDNFWTAYTFNSGSGVETGVSNVSPLAGVPWEVQVALANESGKDIYINIPSNVSTSYLTNLADLFAYGSDGVTPYTSVQANPVWPPLNPNLKVYIEFSNEIWNQSFVQSEWRGNGWANQLSQRALYDYLTNNQNDPLYPGSGSNAYNDGEILAAYFNVNSGNDSTFLNTYNSGASPSADGSSPSYFSNSAAINGYALGQDWVGLRIVQISDAFKTAFGETDTNAVATDSRVRPLFEWQYGGLSSGALGFINGVYGAQHPVNYYLYGGGGGWYAGDSEGGFSDVSFVNPAFANGLTGWSSSGSAGVVNNGSNMGNPNAPPLFSAIAITNGATESGNTVTITTTAPQYFVAGQSVTVSGVNVSGYNGTFTVQSSTSTTFTYQDSTTGLANSGDGFVTGTGPSTQTAYLQPGASISQNVTFSDGYADITLYAAQTVPASVYYGLTITLTPTNGGPAINNGQPILESEGATSYSGNQNSFVWDRTDAFYTGASDYTYTVTFTNTLPSGTVFFDNVAIQTVNGMFNETTAALPNISADIESDVNLALDNGLYDVGYEGGFFFDQNQSGYLDYNGYRDMGSSGYSSGGPNVGMYANLDPRAEQLAIDTFDIFYAAGGTLPVVFQSTGNINSWAVAAPYYFNTNTPKSQAAASVEETAQPATYGLKPGQQGTYSSYWLQPGDAMQSTYLVPLGTYELDMWFESYPGNLPLTDSVEVILDGRPIETVNVPVQTGATFTVSLGTLTAGQHSVEIINTAPSGNPYIFLASVGSGNYVVNNTGPGSPPINPSQPSITWGAPSPIVYWTALGSSQLDAIANVPGTFAYVPAAGAVFPIGVDTLSVTFTPNDSTDYTTATATTTITVVPAAFASLIKRDATTQGNWIGSYGSQGYDVIGDASSLPSYATVTPAGQGSYTWTTSSTDPRALEETSGSNRIAAVWYSFTSFTIDVNLTDGQTHDLGLYFLDWDGNGRDEQVQITNAATGAVLDTESVSSFHSGVYLQWAVSGNVLITITNIAGPSANAVLSGLFLDPVSTSAATATYLKQDTTTQGNWIGTYGSQGYDVIGNATSLPGYATVTPAGQSSYTWAANPTDPRALEETSGSNRIAAVWYSPTSFTVDVNLTDGKTHDLGLYFLDWDGNGRDEQVQITNAATGAVLDTESVSSFHSGVYLQWAVSGNVLITITNIAGPSANAVLSGLFLDPMSTSAATATYLKQDTTTQGNWIGTYGTQGYDVIDNASSLPSYATVTPSGQNDYVWAASTTDPRALQTAGGSSRIAATWWTTTSFTVDVNLTDGQTHDLELYLLDWDRQGRTEQVQISNAATGAVLDTESVSSFHSGVYLQWAVSGNVLITITNIAGPSANAVLSGLFLDPVSTSAATATYLKQDTTTQGNWIGTYGSQGYDVIGDASSLPSYATVTPAGQGSYTWTTSSTDPRALEETSGSNRIAAVWYSFTSFTIDVNLADGQTHDLGLYFLDWDGNGRDERVQITNAATGAVLDTESGQFVPLGRLPAMGRQWQRADYDHEHSRTLGQRRPERIVPGPDVDLGRHGHVPEAGHDDAGELDRNLRRPGLRRDRRPVQPAELRHRDALGPERLRLGVVHHRQSRPANSRRVEPDRGNLVDDDELHGRRQPDRRSDARPGAVPPRLGQAGPDRAGADQQRDHRTSAEHPDRLVVPVGGVPGLRGEREHPDHHHEGGRDEQRAQRTVPRSGDII